VGAASSLQLAAATASTTVSLLMLLKVHSPPAVAPHRQGEQNATLPYDLLHEDDGRSQAGEADRRP
jgi:hypothetical protein